MKWLIWLALGTLSCAEPVQLASGGLSKPAAAFPSEPELRALEADAQPGAVQGTTGIIDVDQWQLTAQGPLPAQYPSETPWDRLTQSSLAAHGNGVQLSVALRCAAHEAARFYTQNAGMPDGGLRQKMLLRCGSTLPAHAFSYAFGTAPDGVSPGRIEASLTPLVKKLLDARFEDTHGEFGLAFARGHGRYVVVAFSGRPRAVLAAFSPIIQGNSLTLSGELTVTAEDLLAFANQGKYGVARCEVDPEKRLPAFRVTCPVAASDAVTRIDIASRESERVLLRPAASIEVRRAEAAALDYDAAAYGDNRVVASAEAFRNHVFSGLNQVRSSAGLQPLALQQRQSATNQTLAPSLYRASLANDDGASDTLALGLLAGWDVSGGTIKNGGLFLSSVNTARNPSRWLTQALDSPLGRSMLLEPGMTQVAIGESDLAPAGAMGVVTTYAFFTSSDHQEDEEAVLAALNRQRVARGMAAARRIPSEPVLIQALAHVRDGSTTSDSALQNAMEELRRLHGREVTGGFVETTDIRQFRFDDSLLEPATLSVEIAIAHYRAPAAAWGQYVVLFVVLERGPLHRTATNEGQLSSRVAHFRPRRGPLLVYSAPP